MFAQPGHCGYAALWLSSLLFLSLLWHGSSVGVSTSGAIHSLQKCTIQTSASVRSAKLSCLLLLVYSTQRTTLAIPRHMLYTLLSVTLPPTADKRRTRRDVAVRQSQRVIQL